MSRPKRQTNLSHTADMNLIATFQKFTSSPLISFKSTILQQQNILGIFYYVFMICDNKKHRIKTIYLCSLKT